MATKTARNPSWKYGLAGRTTMEVEERLADGDATWKAGQFLYDKNDGLIYTCADNSVALKYYALQDLDTAIGADTTYKRMARTHEDDVWEMNVYHGTAASAVATEAQVGNRYALVVVSNVCQVDISDIGNDAFIVVEPVWRDSEFKDDSTDVYARVLVRILESVVSAQPGS